MSKREASQIVRQHGAVVVDQPAPEVDLIVIGEEGLTLLEPSAWDEWYGSIQAAGDEGRTEIISETQLWERLGLLEPQQDIHRLYTPAMLADLLGVSIAVVRRWHRRGLIVPAREVRRLPYFDFREVTTARRLAELLAAGMSPQAIEKKLSALGRYFPGVARPLAQLSVIVEGKEILLRQGAGLIEPGGQLRFDFEAAEEDHGFVAKVEGVPEAATGAVAPRRGAGLAEAPMSADEMCLAAAELEEEGRLEAAAEMYRAAMAAAGPRPETCFHLAELLYRLGDLSGARERYYMAIELDEDYVEARANLGCVLAETGQRELAVAAFEGALAFHGDYADVYYHLARTLDELGRRDEAIAHWQTFLELSPDSPWAERARQRLAASARREK